MSELVVREGYVLDGHHDVFGTTGLTRGEVFTFDYAATADTSFILPEVTLIFPCLPRKIKKALTSRCRLSPRQRAIRKRYTYPVRVTMGG